MVEHTPKMLRKMALGQEYEKKCEALHSIHNFMCAALRKAYVEGRRELAAHVKKEHTALWAEYRAKKKIIQDEPNG